MDWFLYDDGLRHERFKIFYCILKTAVSKMVAGGKYALPFLFQDIHHAVFQLCHEER